MLSRFRQRLSLHHDFLRRSSVDGVVVGVVVDVVVGVAVGVVVGVVDTVVVAF